MVISVILAFCLATKVMEVTVTCRSYIILQNYRIMKKVEHFKT